jgi:hypothetical protein
LLVTRRSWPANQAVTSITSARNKVFGHGFSQTKLANNHLESDYLQSLPDAKYRSFHTKTVWWEFYYYIRFSSLVSVAPSILLLLAAVGGREKIFNLLLELGTDIYCGRVEWAPLYSPGPSDSWSLR